MKKVFFILICCISLYGQVFAGNGDSIFNMPNVHTLHVTFPYPTFYDSLVASHTTDIYLQVDIDFDGEVYTNVGIKTKGNSSFNNSSQKKSFKIDMNEFIAGQDIHGLKKLNFNNGFKDPSFMREKLLSNFLIAHQLPAPRVSYCNVYFNNQLWGLYTILEEVDDEFCKHWFNSNDGNLFKGDPHGDLKWKGSTTQSLYESSYELKNNTTANNWSDLIALIDVINNTPNSTLQNSLESKLNTADFVKQWAIYNMFSSLDSYIGSGHNYYIYHDTVTDKFQWIAWDNNEAFGSFKNNLTTTQIMNLDIDYLSQATSKPLCNNMLTNSFYKAMYHDAYCNLKNDFTNAYFDPIMDSLKIKIQASVYADPKKFYTNGGFDSSFNYDIVGSGPGSISVFGLKTFIQTRTIGINTSITANGVNCAPQQVADIEPKNNIRIYPNPCNDILSIQSGMPMYSILLYDITGKIILRKQLKSSLAEDLDFKDYAQGLYFIQVDGGMMQKVLK